MTRTSTTDWSAYTATDASSLDRVHRKSGSIEATELSGDAAHVYLSELYVQPDDRNVAGQAMVCVVIAQPADQNADGHPQRIAFFALEQDVDAEPGSKGIGMGTTDVLLGVLPKGFENSYLSVRVYRVQSTRRTQPLLDEIARLLPAVEYAKDVDGSRYVAESILERIGALSFLPGGSIALDGIGTVRGDEAASYVVHATPLESKQHPIVLDGRLHVRTSNGATEPWREASFALIEVGPQRTGASFIRALDQLYLERRLASEAAPRGDASSALAPESYLDRDRRLRRTRDLVVRYGEQAMRRPVFARALSIRLSSDLMEHVVDSEGEIQQAFRASLEMVRDGLLYESGFKIPPIDVREDSGISAAGGYVLRIWDMPIVSGTVRMDRVLVNDTVDRLRLLNIEGEESVNPANGSECAWIPVESKDLVEQAGLTTWDAQGYVVLHISAVARKNYASFFTIDSATDHLKEASPELHRRVLEASGGMARLTTVLRSLLTEEASIKVLRPLCERYLELVAAGRPNDEIVEELRFSDAVRLQSRLNKSGVPIWELGPHFLSALQDGIDVQGAGRLLALEPNLCQEMLSAVRNEVSALPPTAKNPVLLVDDWRLRAHVRRLVELEFPHLAVVARRELLDPSASPLIGVIETDGPDGDDDEI